MPWATLKRIFVEEKTKLVHSVAPLLYVGVLLAATLAGLYSAVKAGLSVLWSQTIVGSICQCLYEKALRVPLEANLDQSG